MDSEGLLEINNQLQLVIDLIITVIGVLQMSKQQKVSLAETAAKRSRGKNAAYEYSVSHTYISHILLIKHNLYPVNLVLVTTFWVELHQTINLLERFPPFFG